MKLFQQLLVAPAALGLLAPLAANAAEVNINTVDYASPVEQGYKTSSAQFSDVVPGDWAYTALKNLSESYGCVDNAYTQSLQNGQALTRYEAAALINACLEGGLSASNQGVSSDASRLADEFASEMAILKGRVDGLEYKINEFEAGQFATSTKMSGSAVLVTGISEQNHDGTRGSEALHTTYRYGLDLTTDFGPGQALTVGIETGNTDSANDYVLLSDYVDPTTDGELSVTSLYYTFPVGDVDVAVGPLLDQDDVVPTTTSTYSNSFMLDGWMLGPNALSLNGTTGTGAAVAYADDNGFNAGISLVSVEGHQATSGIASDESNDVLTVMAGWDGDNWGGGVVYTAIDDPQNIISTAGGYTVPTSYDENPNVIGVGAYWNINDSVDASVAADFIDIGIAGYEDATTFALGVDYAGVGPGTLSAGFATIPYWDASNNYDSAGSAYELYYQYSLGNGITIKPGVMVVNLESAYETSEFTSYAVEATFNF